jgi:hypothetical protein
MKEFGFSDKEFLYSIERKFYSERLINERVIRTISEEELEKYYLSHQNEFSGKTFQQAYTEVKKRAEQEASKEYLVKYLTELKIRFPVRVLLEPSKN